MVFKSRFKSKCSLCSKPIEIGDHIEWEPGGRGRHIQCSRPKTWATEIDKAQRALEKLKEKYDKPLYSEEAYVRKMFGKR